LMNIRSDVPAEVIGIVTAIIILLVSSSFTLPGRQALMKFLNRGKTETPATAATKGSAS
jgi:hypothetical protein